MVADVSWMWYLHWLNNTAAILHYKQTLRNQSPSQHEADTIRQCRPPWVSVVVGAGEEEGVGGVGANHAPPDDNHAPPAADKPPPEPQHKKEKSVLQAKLTKLAIQVSAADHSYSSFTCIRITLTMMAHENMSHYPE